VNRNGIANDQGKLAEFCRRNHIRKLSLFGSVLRDDFRPDSDADVLVEFELDHVPGLRFLLWKKSFLTFWGERLT